jgi:ATP-dependent RNA helicase DeaD
VAARGIDLPNLGLVIHADLPNDAEVLQHRSGRTGRAGRKGVSILLVPNSRRRRAEEMLNRARVNYTWTEPPSADDIRKLDQDRLLQNPILTEPGSEDDLAMADVLLAAHPPRDIAAAFVKLYRAQLPASEDIADVVAETRQDTRGPRQHARRPDGDAPRQERPREERPRENTPRDKGKPPRNQMVDGVWFKITVGRERNADPKWLLPEICRQGEIGKKDIGAIRVHDTETRFEVSRDVAEKFAALVGARKKGGVRIFPAPDGETGLASGNPAAGDPQKQQPGANRSDRKPRNKWHAKNQRAKKAG